VTAWVANLTCHVNFSMQQQKQNKKTDGIMSALIMLKK
jgi:hypothetical protein